MFAGLIVETLLSLAILTLSLKTDNIFGSKFSISFLNSEAATDICDGPTSSELILLANCFNVENKGRSS